MEIEVYSEEATAPPAQRGLLFWHVGWLKLQVAAQIRRVARVAEARPL